MSLQTLFLTIKGGAGSGNWGHAGRSGKRGGSAPLSGIGAAMSLRTGPSAKRRQQEASQAGQKQNIPINQKTKDRLLEQISKIGYLRRETKQYVDDIKSLVKGAPVSMRVPKFILSSILDDGRFKNQHETGTSEGMLNPKYRADAERNAFGEDLSKPTDFPVYAYVDTEANGLTPGVRMYGNIKVTFKDNIKDRTTITADDSLNYFADGSMTGTPINNPGPEGVDSVNPTSAYYIEAQIHGGLKTSDIAKVEGAINPSDARKLTELGIDYEVKELN